MVLPADCSDHPGVNALLHPIASPFHPDPERIRDPTRRSTLPGALASAGAAEEARDNHLLDRLSVDEWVRWRPWLMPMDLLRGQVLCDAGQVPTDAVFPTTAVVSLLHILSDGASTEVAAVGREGMIGIALVMGGGAASGQAVVQSAGRAWRLQASVLRDEMRRAGPALRLLLCYTQALTAQVAQTAACDRYHTIDQQLCRRLLTALDQTTGDELALTQEAMAHLLGVRREGVTAAALKLQQAGAIRYHRGRVQVLDRAHIERLACECHGNTRREQDRLMPGRSVRRPSVRSRTDRASW
jgi:CRP-like cAMP-binding protein